MASIEYAEIVQCRIPLENSYQLSSAIGAVDHAAPVIIKLHAADGTVGVGETDPKVPFTQQSPQAVTSILEEYLPAILGDVDVTNRARLNERLDAVLGAENLLTKAAIDVAGWDLFGKQHGLPIFELLGGALREEIPILKPLGNDPVAENVEKVAAELEDGFTSFMLKTGYFSLETDVERLAALRDHFGEDVDIVVDANQGWNAATAIEFVNRAERFDVEFLEQPVPAADIDGLRRVREASTIPVSADEGLFSVDDARRHLAEQAVDLFSIKTAKHGGISRSKQIMDIARAFDRGCFMNSMIEAGVTQAASIHLGATATNLVDIGHAYMSPLRLGDTITDYERLITDHGTVRVPDDPGLGVNLVEAQLAEYATDVTEVPIP